MAFDAYDTNTTTGDDPAAFAAVTKARNDYLVAHGLSSSADAGFADGWLWADNTTATRILWKFGINSGTGFLIGYDSANSRHVAEANLDMDSNELVNARVENVATGSLTTAAAGSEGVLEMDTTQKKLTVIGDTLNHYAAECAVDASQDIRIPMRMHVAAVGTPATASTATEFGGWTMDAAAEELVGVARVPAGWTTAHDLTIEVQCLLLAAETASDIIHMDGVWVSVTPGSGDAATKAETGFAAITPNIGAANAQYDLHTNVLVVDHDDATNPVAAGDMIRATINHDVAGATPVAGIIVVAMDLVVPCFNYNG